MGMDVHLLVHQLDRSRSSRPVRMLHVRADARRPADVGVDSRMPSAHEGLLFAIAYAFIQVGRSRCSCCWRRVAMTRSTHRNFQRISALACDVRGMFWIAGGTRQRRRARGGLWMFALALEMRRAVCGLLRARARAARTPTDWKVDGAHMAERCALFVMIALGESILVTGATAAAQPATAAGVCAFLVAFFGSVAMWWIYFNIGAERGSREITGSAGPGAYTPRAVYTYFHIPIIAGIVVGAVGDERA